METSTSLGRAFSRLFTLAVIAATLAGCAATKVGDSIRFKSETELGVSAIRLEWLKRCEGLTSPMPTNDTGNLLQDYADMAGALRLCMDRHNSFVEYLTPIVKKEQEGNP